MIDLSLMLLAFLILVLIQLAVLVSLTRQLIELVFEVGAVLVDLRRSTERRLDVLLQKNDR